MSAVVDPPTDFDFLVGTFAVRHRRLRVRLAGCEEWDHFDGTCTSRVVLGGHGLVEDNLIGLPDGPYRALGVRSWDPATRSWSIWWLDGRRPHELDPPVVGRFGPDGTGTFAADDHHDGHPVVVRFRWTDVTATSARWEQAFSPDGGATWEVNWVMAFTRVEG
jgi:hypothetical protein